MEETKWDQQEAKRLKKKQLVQSNLMVLLVFVLSMYYVWIEGSFSVFISFFCLFLWLITAHALYTLVTGNVIGTKTFRLVHAFYRDRWGHKRWKKRKIAETIFSGVLSVVCTMLLFMTDLGSQRLEMLNLWPFIGAWFGFNVGELFRISQLQ